MHDFISFILDSKRNAYFQFPSYTRNPYPNFTLNDMNMFERTHAFVPDHFIRHYTVNYYFLLINVKKCKSSAVHWETHDLNPISLYVTITHCNR